jgi:hypothetical protein
MEMSFGTWNVRSFYRAGSVKTILWVENLKGKDHLEDEGIDGNIILDWSLEKYGRRV